MPEAIHADWPAYPAGHGQEYALETLCCFPSGTHFRVIDDIDECFLLVSVEHQDRSHRADPFSDRHHHVALWHEDLRRLRDEGWLEGFRPRATADELREYGIKQAEALPEAVRAAAVRSAKSFDWECAVKEATEEDQLARDATPAEGLVVTSSGWMALWSHDELPKLAVQMSSRVEPLLRIGYLDSAVREAAIILEKSLRVRTGTQLWGQSLVKSYVAQIIAKAGQQGAFQRHVRSELRTLFMFVRNEFAHNIVSLDRGRCYAMLLRISVIYDMLDQADQGACSFQDIILSAAENFGTLRKLD